MDARKIVFRETLTIAIGELICTALMVGVFALLGFFDRTVLLGALVGLILAVGNFFFMAVSTSLAADKAAQQDVKNGKAMVQSSYILRLLVIFVILFACAKSGWFDPFAMVLPLAFVRPVITVSEFFRKKGENQA